MDLAHNEAGLEALLEIMNGVRRPGARLLLGLGAVGDRTDDLIEKLGEIGARDSDVVAIGHKEQLPARPHHGGARRRCCGPAPSGSASPTSRPTRPRSTCLAALVEQAEPGDVVGLMCHAERAGGLRLDRRARRHRRTARRRCARRCGRRPATPTVRVLTQRWRPSARVACIARVRAMSSVALERSIARSAPRSATRVSCELARAPSTAGLRRRLEVGDRVAARAPATSARRRDSTTSS